jgi:SAM-dependent methyltransferase
VKDRSLIEKLVTDAIAKGDTSGDWFEQLYSQATLEQIPWADLAPNPHLAEWLKREQTQGHNKRALVVGCGLGDDAEALAAQGFAVTAFDLSSSAVAWCKKRFPHTSVEYVQGDVLKPHAAWQGAFDFIFEAYTLQVLPPLLRQQAMTQIAPLLKAGGRLLVVARGRDPREPEGTMPMPLTKADLAHFVAQGLTEARFEDYWDQEDPPKRRFRVEYVR